MEIANFILSKDEDAVRGRKREYILLKKLVFTIFIFGIYILGTNVPLYGVDVSEYMNKDMGMDRFLIQTISGDLNQCSIFNLGIFPYMISSLLIQIIYALKTEESKKRVSAGRRNSVTLLIAIIISCIQALTYLDKLNFSFPKGVEALGYTLVYWEMVAGSMVIIFLCSQNKRYGLGGQTIIILANILRSITTNISDYSIEEIIIPLLLSLIVMLVVILMENTEFRIPLQRISIHNIYADKNYLAIKMNPVGVMPAMFSSAFFLLPQLAVMLILYFFPDNIVLLLWQKELSLTRIPGIVVYLIILYILTICFSFLFINPKDITEQFLKSGDSLLNIHMGKETQRYLRGTMLRISLFSATVMAVCLGIPLYLQYLGRIEGTLNTLPSSIMMLTGVICTLLRETEAIKNMESYKTFI